MATAQEVKAFIEMIAPIAVRQAEKHGNKIYPSVCIGQACNESSFGTSPKMKAANAVFGIKVGNAKYHFGTAWKDKAYSTKTKEFYNGQHQSITDLFRAYDSIEDATEDYFDMLCTASRYKSALNAPDYKTCIRAIAPSYATAEANNHSYSNSIISIIEKYNLTRYDPEQKNPYALTDTVMKIGSRGESVKWLQFQLRKAGYDIVVDGIYGPKSEAAVKDYQIKVFADGIAGPLTIDKLKTR